MKLVFGLGNPGVSYLMTRHNTGYIFVDKFQRSKIPEGVLVRKTNIFMNQSGDFVKVQADKYHIKLQDIFVVHDDLDIPLGEFKIQFNKAPKDHNGLKSINDKLGSSAYWHVRVGVDNRDPDDRTSGEEYVLQNFKDNERQRLDEVINQACKKLATLLKSTN